MDSISFLGSYFFSQMGTAFETQSATLQSLRNYIGQLTPERGLEEKLTETIQVGRFIDDIDLDQVTCVL